MNGLLEAAEQSWEDNSWVVWAGEHPLEACQSQLTADWFSRAAQADTDKPACFSVSLESNLTQTCPVNTDSQDTPILRIPLLHIRMRTCTCTGCSVQQRP